MRHWIPRLRPMRPQDLPAVVAIEETVFGDDAWPLSTFQRDLANEHSTYVVLELGDAAGPAQQPVLAGYAGYWLLDDEAHLMNLAIAPAWQGRKLGELLLLESLAIMQQRGANLCTLEVRISNQRAQALYRRLGFEVAGRRRRYYQDNGEDALIMTTPLFSSPALRQLYQQRRAELRSLLQSYLGA